MKYRVVLMRDGMWKLLYRELTEKRAVEIAEYYENEVPLDGWHVGIEEDDE